MEKMTLCFLSLPSLAGAAMGALLLSSMSLSLIADGHAMHVSFKCSRDSEGGTGSLLISALLNRMQLLQSQASFSL